VGSVETKETGWEPGHISTIIPTRNEEAQLGALLASLRDAGAEEVLVADAHSTDRTVEVARARGVSTLAVAGSAARQLNLAAERTRGSVLFFLHADSTLLDLPYPAIRRAFGDPAVVAGGFQLHYADPYALVAAVANLRARATGLPMGDQGLFVRRSLFEALGGYPEGPLLPDLELMRSARRHGKVALLPERLGSSPRRYQVHGFLPNLLANQLLLSTNRLTGSRPPVWAVRLLGRLRAPRPVRRRDASSSAAM
jgi:hypothetical protein